MKIIDILNKIANGEEVPKKIKYDARIMEYDHNKQDYNGYYSNGNGNWLFQYLFDKCRDTKHFINDEVEILEEKPEPLEHIYTGDRYLFSSKDNGMTKEDRKQLDSYFRALLLCHDALVNAVNYLLEREK